MQAGFTLMELLVVLVIIGLLAAFVGPILYQGISPAKQTAARSQIEGFMTALDTYLIDVGQFPTTEQGLPALRVNPGLRHIRCLYAPVIASSDGGIAGVAPMSRIAPLKRVGFVKDLETSEEAEKLSD